MVDRNCDRDDQSDSKRYIDFAIEIADRFQEVEWCRDRDDQIVSETEIEVVVVVVGRVIRECRSDRETPGPAMRWSPNNSGFGSVLAASEGEVRSVFMGFLELLRGYCPLLSSYPLCMHTYRGLMWSSDVMQWSGVSWERIALELCVVQLNMLGFIVTHVTNKFYLLAVLVATFRITRRLCSYAIWQTITCVFYNRLGKSGPPFLFHTCSEL